MCADRLLFSKTETKSKQFTLTLFILYTKTRIIQYLNTCVMCGPRWGAGGHKITKKEEKSQNIGFISR